MSHRERDAPAVSPAMSAGLLTTAALRRSSDAGSRHLSCCPVSVPLGETASEKSGTYECRYRNRHFMTAEERGLRADKLQKMIINVSAADLSRSLTPPRTFHRETGGSVREQRDKGEERLVGRRISQRSASLS